MVRSGESASFASGANMKRNQSHRRTVLQAVRTAVLAAALVAGPGLAGVAFAVEPAPTPTSDSYTASVSSPAPSASVRDSAATQTASPVATQAAASTTTTAAPTSSPVSVSTNETMAEAVGVGGAEMGQRSARVAASSSSNSFKKISSEALGTEGTWTPTFGIQGLDVSGHQPSIDWQQQWNMGARFAYVKASEGNYYTNPSYGSQYQGSRNVGMIRGAYHFAIPNWSSGADQARYFVQNGGGWTADGYTMPPVLDFEFNPYEGRTINGFYFGNTCYGMSPAQLASWVRDFGNTMQGLTGRLPVIYTNTNWWNQCLGNPTGFGDYPLWVAAYPGSPTNDAGAVPTASWGTYSIWQYSSTGPFAGDSNVWNGDYSSLRTFAGAPAPIGSFDELSLKRTEALVELSVRGWAVDLADISKTTEAHAYVTAPNGTRTGYVITANSSRPDVGEALGVGSNHGFLKTIPINASGTYQVCVYSIGANSNTSLGCKSLTAKGVEPPIGSIDEFREIRTPDKSALLVRGWAVDMANASSSTQAHAYVTGPDGVRTGYAIDANLARPDVDQVLRLGTNHGYEKEIPITKPGQYSVCVYSIGQYSNTHLGCTSLTVALATLPTGYLDGVSMVKTSTSASIKASGWALDRGDAGRSIQVHVYVTAPDGSVKSYPYTASQPRPDVNSVLGVSGNHGYETSISVSKPGVYGVCAYAIALSPIATANPLLGCTSIDAGRSGSPIGYLDSARIVSPNGQVSLESSGWTLDPDMATQSNPVHVYVTSPDGKTTGYVFSTTINRADVNNFVGTSGRHGYSTLVQISQRGKYTVCSYGIGISPFTSGNTLLGCQTVTY